MIWRQQIAIKKEAIKEEPWNFTYYEDLYETWEDFTSFIMNDNRINIDKSIRLKETKSHYDYWNYVISSTQPNCCVGYMQAKFLGYTKDGLRDPNDKVSDAGKIDFLSKQLSSYDGKNGSECAARIALWMADIYQTSYSPIHNFDLAKQYAEKAKTINADLVDDSQFNFRNSLYS